MSDLKNFRETTRAWLEENCPPGARGPGEVSNGSTKIVIEDSDTRLWLERMVEKGWTVPSWPKAYGGGGLSTAEYVILLEEMKRISGRPALSGFGTSMIGPTLLEYGTEEQKLRHLPRIARAEVEWCQGYSEPGAGSDLASLQTRAMLDGDNYVINGSKIWTSGAHNADWMFILVRTNPDAPKHEGISFMLLPMDQPGVEVRPIKLISGNSPFNETFFDDALAAREDLVGELDRGWTVGKRLLQHERSGMESLLQGGTSKGKSKLSSIAKDYIGEADGKIADSAMRDQVLQYEMAQRSLNLTKRRVIQESADGATLGPATSIFKVMSTDLEKIYSDLATSLRGSQGFGWEGDAFTDTELEDMRVLLSSRAASIYSGSNEIQRNIIAKRVLGLPD
ncbi:MAG: acyl-CoA dehydrogenase [Gammaproteobacteria bacterium]|jgi:alkylation response protein AidB-like acyl-CoA dehydrogenase|nr:acyl-CoA dehydrogenase [Gammaproteobacteria bacterium]MBT4381311.1 acyl-CoA dehydrogenase [Gammaproteobacteria bacterium]MBT4615169.1 acyl-CoA dehydrogenase [Gammaproteobacteria bacterium]MBT5197309.1 acyl-CoA dehydrogenase [Gammaproteobacteria bacterium]MBT5442757.1 acyl-CoA dehydrogenase [Gammaproteobacteria bacterium]